MKHINLTVDLDTFDLKISDIEIHGTDYKIVADDVKRNARFKITGQINDEDGLVSYTELSRQYADDRIGFKM